MTTRTEKMNRRAIEIMKDEGWPRFFKSIEEVLITTIVYRNEIVVDIEFRRQDVNNKWRFKEFEYCTPKQLNRVMMWLHSNFWIVTSNDL